MSITFDIDSVPAHDRERVADMIPDPRIADGYVHRSIEGFEDFELFDYAINERENILLAGPTGSSKTTAFRAYAASRGLPFALVECNAAMDPGMVVGRITTDEEGNIGWVDGELTLVVRYGGVVLIDEVNMAHPRVTAAFHQLLAVTRRISLPETGKTVKAGAGGDGEVQPVLIAAAYNPHYQGVVRLNEALTNRFALPFDWNYVRSVEEQLIASPTLLDFADNVRSLSDVRSPLSTNALMEFERHTQALNFEFASKILANRFSPEERGPVARALNAHAVRIVSDLGLSGDDQEVAMARQQLEEMSADDESDNDN